MDDSWGCFSVGDVIQVGGPTVPIDLRDKYFKVAELRPDDGQVILSCPYQDKDCTKKYQPWKKRQ